MTSETRHNPAHRLVQAIAEIPAQSIYMLAIVLIVMTIIIAPKAWLLSAIDHEIEQFQVHGELKNLEVREIETQLSAWLGSSFLTADLEQIKADVEALEWVHRATVTRIWPGKILLNLREQAPVAYWNGNAFLNSDGDVFSPESIDSDMALPVLVGPEESEQFLRAEMLAEMSQLSALLSPYLLSAQRLEVNERGSWAMTLGNGLYVQLGSRPFDDKVERLARVLNSEAANKHSNMESIDTRYPNGVAVKWKDVALAARTQ